jgi:hypothetical protein
MAKPAPGEMIVLDLRNNAWQQRMPFADDLAELTPQLARHLAGETGRLNNALDQRGKSFAFRDAQWCRPNKVQQSLFIKAKVQVLPLAIRYEHSWHRLLVG